MRIEDLIKEKDYDYIEYRMTIPSGANIFAGHFSSKAGKIISLDGDSYSASEEVLSYKEWSKPQNNIKNGLTVVVKGNWM